MEETFIFEGKTSTEALEKGLKELNVKKSDVEYKIIENEEKRSFFSILTPRVVKVQIKVINKEKGKRITDNERKPLNEKEMKEIKEKLEKFIAKFVKTLPDNNVKYEINCNNGFININLLGDNLNYLIGYRGEVLNSLQTLSSTIASQGTESRVNVRFDIYGYREKRNKKLRILADKMAQKAIRQNKRVVLEPMSAYDRKAIHERLQNHPKVETKSIGVEPNRKVVILLK